MFIKIRHYKGNVFATAVINLDKIESAKTLMYNVIGRDGPYWESEPGYVVIRMTSGEEFICEDTVMDKLDVFSTLEALQSMRITK